MVKDDFILRNLDLVRVVGREQLVRVYELIAKAGEALSPEHLGALKAYAAGYDEYYRQHWPQAISHFKRALELRPDDGPSKTMLERCRRIGSVCSSRKLNNSVLCARPKKHG